jgi:hypothetical protein
MTATNINTETTSLFINTATQELSFTMTYAYSFRNQAACLLRFRKGYRATRIRGARDAWLLGLECTFTGII